MSNVIQFGRGIAVSDFPIGQAVTVARLDCEAFTVIRTKAADGHRDLYEVRNRTAFVGGCTHVYGIESLRETIRRA